MAKYTIETKQEIIRLVTKESYSVLSAAKKLRISESVSRRWLKMYEIHGLEGLTKKTGSYSGEFKINVVKYMHQNNLTVYEASAIYGIPSDATLLKWERIYYEEGYQGLLIDKRGRTRKDMSKKPKKPKIQKDVKEDLIAEVQRLRAENDYLKKYNALVQEKQNLKILKKQK